MFLTILSIGNVNLEIVNHVRKVLAETFPKFLCRKSESPFQIPKDAYNQTRRQYNSRIILSNISKYAMKQQLDRVLGITDCDLYVPDLNFVFGQAQHLGKAAIISLQRLKPEFYGRALDIDVYKARAVKEAVHEIGHTLGLEHCRNPVCVMYFSNSILDTDRKTATLCAKCNLLVCTNH